jgi:hypothetical protein
MGESDRGKPETGKYSGENAGIVPGNTGVNHRRGGKKKDEKKVGIGLNLATFHSFPNVLIEILDELFAEFERNLSGWFGKKKRSRAIIQGIREKFRNLRQREDNREQEVKRLESTGAKESVSAKVSIGKAPASVGFSQ